ncbi:zinc transport system substrate-binding protein [Geosporobacter subterraneus DSM 17957]|uniref:Zinc transport system substrate-binding protein n=1 Tax=Geosporobacter subterraneus DSM 17957 TaxID=1121919 RepID=A0A1M6DL07_9FIRM|nr:metal ABC transporter substrate-binding protein [Geosporobacter subterraneus]SHI73658.1 zinc transport system substrate-binding protein [Geosporobacter subterraneus DSM 17957]
MKSKGNILIVVLLIVTMVLSAGCGKVNTPPAQGEGVEEKLLVYASFYPMYDFATKIGGDKAEVRMMVPPGVEAHDWEPTAKLMGEIEKADVLIYNGLDMEPWADKLLGAIQNDKLITVEAVEGIELLKTEEEAEDEHEEEDHAHGEFDPHVWLDPMNAMKQAENIKNAFIQADEANKDYYEANYQEFAKKLIALDEQFKQELSSLKRKEIVVAHAAFGYLTNRYGLEQIAIRGISPQEEPSAAKMAEISKFAKQHDVKYIFFETLTNPKLAEVLAREVGAQTMVLNPLEGLTEEELKAGKDYFAVMEENLAALKKALGE